MVVVVYEDSKIRGCVLGENWACGDIGRAVRPAHTQCGQAVAATTTSDMFVRECVELSGFSSF